MSNVSLPPEDDFFSGLGLHESLIQALKKSGYTTPTPIQSKMIPHVMAGTDVVGQAQTGTGKTAAFALPLLHRLRQIGKTRPQILVLTPTRELALQVAESFVTYGQFMKNVRVLPVFGGQDYASQLQELKRGVNIVVGTPGRVMDHIRRGSLNLDAIESLVLDEADEMLKMGFLEDVEWILEQTPATRQIALFSATMPASIRRIAKTHLTDPVEISIKDCTENAPDISQYYLLTQGLRHKSECLERILEMETFEGVLIFVRTKIQTVEISEQLAERGYACGPLNGDIAQNQRLRMVDQLKSGKLDIVVATDVAARGLDVERISHVINFDIPFDTEAYIHRIGRTGRAGRSGKAILFLSPREKMMLKAIEKATRQKIQMMNLPTVAEINTRRIETYKNEITAALATDCSFFKQLIDEYCTENETPAVAVAAALAKMGHGKTPLLLQSREVPTRISQQKRKVVQPTNSFEHGGGRKSRSAKAQEQGMERYRIEVGSAHGVKPGNIVGAIANEADLSSEHIGRIAIFDEYSTVDLPYGMPTQIMKLLQKTHILDRKLRIRKESDANESEHQSPERMEGESRKKVKSSAAYAPRRKEQNKRPHPLSVTR